MTTTSAVTLPASKAALKPRFKRRRPERLVPRGYETVRSVLLTEPRIEAIRSELAALLELVQLEVDGNPVEIDGFRLRDATVWSDYPTSLSDIFWHLSSVCNFYCDFCYEKGNPPGFPIQNTPRMATEQEVETRLRHYDTSTHLGLFTVRTSINEPFANKRAIHVLRAMRRRCPDELISFVTNGSYLDDRIVSELAELGPLFFNLSVYSTDPVIRRQVLRDAHPERAIEAVNLLARHEVPYMSNVVMWPTIPFDDLERTVAFMDERRASVVRVCLGGYTRYMHMEADAFAVDDYWPRVVDAVEGFRERYAIPILIEPNSFVRTDTEAVIDGVVAGSPAARAGLRRGDVVERVDGRSMHSRMQLMSALRNGGSACYRPPGVASGGMEGGTNIDEVTLSVRRGGERLVAVLDRYEPAAMERYPYAQIAAYNDFAYGLLLTDCLRYSSLQAAERLMDMHASERPLLLTSVMIRPQLEYMIAKSGAFGERDVDVRVAPNRYFGGTINIGDLLVVSDFVAAVEDARRAGRDPDLVLIPSSPFASSPWGRDLTGRPWTDIERLAGVPVVQIPCSTLTM